MSSESRTTGLGVNIVLRTLAAQAEARGASGQALVERVLAARPDLPMAGDMEYQHDDVGSALSFEFMPLLPRPAIALVDVVDDALEPLRSRDPLFSDQAGRFLYTSEFAGQRCRSFIPHAVLDYPRAGWYRVRLRCVAYDPETDTLTEVGDSRFQLDLPTPPSQPWSRVEFGRPLVWLGMTMARADHNVGPLEMRRLLGVISTVLDTGPSDIPELRRVITRRRDYQIGQVVDLIMARFGEATHDRIMTFLAQLAWADEILDEREFEVIEEVARHLALSRPQWRALVKRHNLRR